MSVTSHTTQDFAYSPDATFDAVMAVVRPLGFSSIAVHRQLRRVNAEFLTPQGDWAVVLHVQPMGFNQRSRLVVGSTPTHVTGAISEDEAKTQFQEQMAQRVIQSVSFYLAGGRSDHRPRPPAKGDKRSTSPHRAWTLLLCFGLVAIAAIVAGLVSLAEAR